MTDTGRTPGDSFEPIPEAAWRIACDTPRPNPPRPNHDKLEVVDPPYQGAPFGGFGAGTFARTYRGDFARWHLHTGYHVYRSLPACAQLIAVHADGELADAFALGPPPEDATLGRWHFRTEGIVYRALYPLSWYDGTAASGELAWRITQLSPIIPHDYRDTSLPVAVFRLALHNAGERSLDVRVATSWENLSIERPGEPIAGGLCHEARVDTDGARAELWMGRRRARHHTNEHGAFALAVGGGVPFAVPLHDPTGDGRAVWDAMTHATIPPAERSGTSAARGAGLLGSSVSLAPGEAREVTFALAWHFPVMAFGGGRRWYRRYTRFYVRSVHGADDDASTRIARDALDLTDGWLVRIADWQQPILEARPPALARTLFNSLYILADGGTAWENGEVPRDEHALEPAPEVPGARDVGRFSILECFTYPYYATLDVRYYGSLPLLYFWPELERQVLLQFAATVSVHDAETREMLHVKETARRKRAGTLPHDLGNPAEDPWVKVNAYDDIDPNRWKDLGPKFVLLVARYLSVVGWEDRGFLRGAWPAVTAAMATLAKQDTDGDGLPENEGIPDQTFDKWPMTGASAYCSGLAIAALDAAIELARWSGNPGKAKAFRQWRRRAVAAMSRKLWNGDTFAFDESKAGREVVMTGQLSGEWALAMTGLGPVIEPERIRSTLETIWATCAVRAGDRLVGLSNGAARPREADLENRHAREIWPGINYPVAALMILHGMHSEATELVSALERMIFEDHPFAFTTPEAWEADGSFRGALYMRALSVWGVEEALRRTEPGGALAAFAVPPAREHT